MSDFSNFPFRKSPDFNLLLISGVPHRESLNDRVFVHHVWDRRSRLAFGYRMLILKFAKCKIWCIIMQSAYQSYVWMCQGSSSVASSALLQTQCDFGQYLGTWLQLCEHHSSIARGHWGRPWHCTDFFGFWGVKVRSQVGSRQCGFVIRYIHKPQKNQVQ